MTDTHADRTFNTMNRPGLRAGLIENPPLQVGFCLPSLHGGQLVVRVSPLQDVCDGARAKDEENCDGDQPAQLAEQLEIVQTVPHDASREQDEEGPPHEAEVHGVHIDLGHKEVGLDMDGAEGPPEVPGLGLLQEGQQPQGDREMETQPTRPAMLHCVLK